MKNKGLILAALGIGAIAFMAFKNKGITNKKKLKPVIEVEPLETISKKQFDAGKAAAKVTNIANTLKNIFASKKKKAAAAAAAAKALTKVKLYV